MMDYLYELYLAWCERQQRDPDDSASASDYEEAWREEHGVPDHHCTGDTLGYCDVCRA